MPEECRPQGPCPPSREKEIFFNIINRFVGYYTQEATRATQNDAAREYPFVAMDTRQVYDQISFVSRHLQIREEDEKSCSFLDVGCGIGNILLIAEQFGFDVYGIEKDAYPFQVAARLVGADKISQDDIWTYDRFGSFDVIYYFRPFSDREPQYRFEKRIEEQMRAGAILIANHKNSNDIDSDQRFRRLSRDLPVWQKIGP